MKKYILILLIFTGYLQAQTYPVNPTKFGKISLNTNGVSTSTTKINTQESDGQINYIDAVNLPVPTSVINAIKQKADLSTGLLKNGLISINADPTKFNVSAGIGIISNFDDPENPTSTIVSFPAFTGVTPTYLLTGNITYIAINSTPSVVMQATPFTTTQRRDLIILGAVIHSNLTTINVVNNISAPSNTVGNQLHDFMEAIGPLNLTGNKYSANGANLSLNKSAGTIFKFGVNFATDWKNPHELSQSAGTALTFRYRTQNGTEGSDVNVVDPSVYDVSNVLTAVPNNKFTIQTVTMFQTGLTRIQYGQSVYDDLASAQAAIFTRDYNVESNIKENGITRAYIIVKNNATSLQNISDSKIIEAQKFGGVASGGIALTFANIVSALGYTPENAANKATDFSTVNNTLYPTVQAVKTYADSKITGTTDFVPVFTGASSIGNGFMYQTADGIKIGAQNTTFGIGYTVSKLLTVINKHSFEDYSLINTVSGNEGFGVFDASTEMTGSNSNDHLNAYQSRLNYSASVGMTGPNFNIYGMTAYLAQNRITGTGHLTVAKGFFARDLGGVAGTVDNLYGLHIDPQTKGSVNNWDIHATGKNNHFGAVMIGPVPAQWNGTDALVNTGISNFSGLAKFTSQVRISSPSNTVPALQIGDYINNFGWGVFESNTTGNFLLKSKNSGTVIDGFEIQRSTGNMGLGGSPTTDKLSITGNAAGSSAPTNANHLTRKDYVDTADNLKLDINNPTATGTLTTPSFTISTLPTTSAGTYDILTRNTSTGVVEKIASSSLATSGSYTPTLTAVTNITSFGTIYPTCHYTRVGNIVDVTVHVVLNTTAATTASEFEVTFPINKAVSGTVNRPIGIGLAQSSGYADAGMHVKETATTTKAKVLFTSTPTASMEVSLTFSYYVGP